MSSLFFSVLIHFTIHLLIMVFFQIICSYVFMPFAFIMGVAWDDCFEVAELLGIKTFVNEFAAYEQLSKLIKNRRQFLPGTKLSVCSRFLDEFLLAPYCSRCSFRY